ncbi:hypothetical protein PR202_gb10515 [Eleusine coracana subsp. coracana]|uniref:BRCT domain-containing protein n=1 Tax=Eleusine coracana subsp. coracana TaxID=191504 RepID=A0AAV5EJI1_ELECO|nr:hypothetical protein PR202_gb10515 [Eleusine coracana subsp. coracana]
MHIIGNCSSEKDNKRWSSQNADSNDHVSDSLAISQSADVLPNEPKLCYNNFVKQGALSQTVSCSGNKERDFQVSTQNSATLHGTLAAQVILNHNILKEGGGVAAQLNVGTKKIVKDLFQDETSFIPESISMEDCRSTSGAASMEIIASSRGFCYKTEGFREENQDAEAEVVSCDEGVRSQSPVCKQSEHNNEDGSNHSPECQKIKGKEKEFTYPNESPKLQDPDGELAPSSVPLAKSPEPNFTSRRRRYNSLRPFSTVVPKSNILEATSTLCADVAVCRQEKFTPITLNKSIQLVQSAKQSIENNVEAGMQGFSKFQKKQHYFQDTNKHQIIEQQVPWEVCQSAENLNVDKQNLKRKRVQFSEAKLSSRRTKNSRRILTKSRFSRSDGRMGETLETTDYIDDKKSIFQGVEFLLTGFHRQKEKEVESLIRKFGGHVLSKVPLFLLASKLDNRQLYSGKLIHLKKDRCAPFRRIKMPSFGQQHVFVMSQEI